MAFRPLPLIDFETKLGTYRAYVHAFKHSIPSMGTVAGVATAFALVGLAVGLTFRIIHMMVGSAALNVSGLVLIIVGLAGYGVCLWVDDRSRLMSSLVARLLIAKGRLLQECSSRAAAYDSDARNVNYRARLGNGDVPIPAHEAAAEAVRERHRGMMEEAEGWLRACETLKNHDDAVLAFADKCKAIQDLERELKAKKVVEEEGFDPYAAITADCCTLFKEGAELQLRPKTLRLWLGL